MKRSFQLVTADSHRLPAIHSTPLLPDPAGMVVLTHGIFSDKAEQGRFDRQVTMLNRMGLATLQYDFRGHGDHGMSMNELSIVGMVLDFQAATLWVKDNYPTTECCWVASSFGAAICMLYLQTRYPVMPHRIVLLNPVLDFRHTILASPLAIGGGQDPGKSQNNAYLNAAASGRLGANFIVELYLLDPAVSLASLRCPTRIVHGTGDRTVSHDVTKAFARRSTWIDFQSVAGADHAFTVPADEQACFDLIASWLSDQDR